MTAKEREFIFLMRIPSVHVLHIMVHCIKTEEFNGNSANRRWRGIVRQFSLSKRISWLIGVEGGDSWGIGMTGEIPQERSDEEAHRMPPGKRPPGTEINGD